MKINSNKNINYDAKIKIIFDKNSSVAFGPGVAKIMALVEKTNNLSEAYRLMGLSSSKGWRIIKQVEKELGFPLFVSEIGGRGGGSTKLSKEGKVLLRKYQSFIEELNIEGKRLFKKHFGS